MSENRAGINAEGACHRPSRNFMPKFHRPPRDLPVLIAGPTASGKSALALEIAERDGGVIVNADALQVYDCWRILTARPDKSDLNRAHHLLYGHVAKEQPYSAGHWLREVSRFLRNKAQRPIIVGGTGLYFLALTEGLTDIPEIPPGIRVEGDKLRTSDPREMVAALDAETVARIDLNNPMRVQRAWEVLRAIEVPMCPGMTTAAFTCGAETRKLVTSASVKPFTANLAAL